MKQPTKGNKVDVSALSRVSNWYFGSVSVHIMEMRYGWILSLSEKHTLYRSNESAKDNNYFLQEQWSFYHLHCSFNKRK